MLKTIDDLRMKPRIHVQSGKPSTKPPKHPLSRLFLKDKIVFVLLLGNPLPVEREYQDEQQLVGSSKIPSIRGALRMYADVALRNVSSLRCCFRQKFQYTKVPFVVDKMCLPPRRMAYLTEN